MRRFVLACACVVTAGSACPELPLLPGQEPSYSSDIGVNGVPLTEGQLAGTWYGQLEFATRIKLPYFGWRNAGANGGRLIRLTWDAGSGVYNWESTWCWDDVFEVEGTRNTFTDETLAALRPMRLPIRVNNERGEMDTDEYVDLWGLHNMPSPRDTPLPTYMDYQSEPQSTWILDEDNDTHPGVTVHISGVVEGDGYILNRSVFRLHGVARTADELIGLVATSSVEQSMVDSTITVPGSNENAGNTEQVPDPDPKASWYQLVRGVEGATCTEVRQARADGVLAARRPF